MADDNVLPAYSPANAGAQRLCNRFLGRKTFGQQALGLATGVVLLLLHWRQDTCHESISQALYHIFNPVNLEYISPYGNQCVSPCVESSAVPVALRCARNRSRLRRGASPSCWAR